jgi:uncharacterized protein
MFHTCQERDTLRAFGKNVARLYSFEQHAMLHRADRFAEIKAEYEKSGPERSNLRYGYIRKPA